MEPKGLPCFLQFAKIGDEIILDIPSSNFFSEGMDAQLNELLKMKYNKTATKMSDEERTTSYQVRFSKPESNKMCYIAKDIFHSILQVEDNSNLTIVMR